MTGVLVLEVVPEESVELVSIAKLAHVVLLLKSISVSSFVASTPMAAQIEVCDGVPAGA